MSDAGRAAVLAALNVSRETTARLDAYAALLAKWNPAINLVARSTMTDFWTRHILDSAQLFDLAPPGARHWADLGSGAGLPGLVIAILAPERTLDLRVTLIDSDQRKAAFLIAALRETGVRAEVRAERIEDLAPLGADIITARALAPLPVLLAYAERHLSAGGAALFPKRRRSRRGTRRIP